MSAENREGLRPSDLQRRINEIAHLKSLEMEHIHVHSLAQEIDPTADKILSREIPTNFDLQEPTFAQRNRTRTRRQSRRAAKMLTKRGL